MSNDQPRFQDVSARVDFPALDARILAFWKEHGIFEKSLEGRDDAPLFVFYEGPPTANGRPGAHHVISRIFKDLFPRYKTMRGYRVPRKAGWDTHGLPVELEVERRLGIDGKGQIEAYGVAEFNKLCRESVTTYLEEWERFTERIGFWVDMDDAYYTYTNDYIESVWWILRQIWDKGLLYQGHKVVPYCPRCGTAISSHEVAQGYKDVTEDSIYVRFPLTAEAAAKVSEGVGGEPRPVSLAVWTTTPWTLISNVAAAVHPDVTYALVESRGDLFVLARDLVEKVLSKKAEVLREFAGAELLGLDYEAPFGFMSADKRAHFVIGGDYVTTTDGTGIVHIAPAFGEEDMRVGTENDLPVVNAVDTRGQVRRRGHAVGRRLRQGRRPGHHRRPQGPRPAARRRALRAQLPVLLALRHGAALLRQGDVVRAHDGHQGPADRRQRRRDLAPGAHQDRALRRVAGRQRRLGAQPRPLLGHAAAHLALRRGPHALRRLDRGAAGDGGRSRSRGSGTPPALRRRRRPHLPRLRRRDAPRPGGHRRLVRLWLHAVRPVALPVRERRSSSSERFPADFICEAIDQTRGWFYSLLAVATLHRGPQLLQARRLPGPHPRRRRPEDEQEQGQRRAAGRHPRPSGRRRLPLVHVREPAALEPAPLQRRHGRRGGAQVPAHPVEHVQLLHAVRQHRPVRPDGDGVAAGRPAAARPLARSASSTRSSRTSPPASRPTTPPAPAARSSSSSTTSATGTCAAAGVASGRARATPTSWPPTTRSTRRS